VLFVFDLGFGSGFALALDVAFFGTAVELGSDFLGTG
jgi:hypothetical protein